MPCINNNCPNSRPDGGSSGICSECQKISQQEVSQAVLEERKRIENIIDTLPDMWWLKLYRTVKGGWGYEIDEVEQTAITADTFLDLLTNLKDE